MSALSNAAASVLDAFYPCVCINCHARIADQKLWLCGTCFDNLSFLPETHCLKCGCPTVEADCSNCAENSYVFDRAISVFMFKDPAKSMIHALKYDGLNEIADWFANKMFQLLSIEKHLTEVDYVTAVPLHKVRRRDRGFNQSELIASALANRLQIPYVRALVRKLNTVSQTVLNGTSRRTNVKDAFRTGKTLPKGKSFLLIDDVFTTGTTVNEAASTLIKAGAEKVFVLTACHG